jgi:hypothetical protein
MEMETMELVKATVVETEIPIDPELATVPTARRKYDLAEIVSTLGAGKQRATYLAVAFARCFVENRSE